MSGQDFILYVDSQFTSPYAMAVFVTLTEKGIPFEVRTVDLNIGEQNQPDFSRLSVSQRVPTLVHGDFTLSESSAICEYLEELFPAPRYAPVYPVNREDRARARQVQAWIRSDLMPIREERSTEVVFYKPTTTPLSENARKAVSKLIKGANSLLSDNRENLFGEWCIADNDLAIMLARLVLNGDEMPENLKAYTHRQLQRASVQAWFKQDR